MKVLGIDSAGSQCAAAVLDGERIAAVRRETMVRGQAERLLPLIAETLEAASVAPASLDLIAATTGPGSFTGIRIGLAAARGLALAIARPAVGVNSFEAYVHAVPSSQRHDRSLVIAIESKRDEFYLQAYSAAAVALAPPAQVLPRDLALWLPPGPLVLAGDAASRLQAALTQRDTIIAPDTTAIEPALVARLAREKHTAGANEPVRPFYLRAPDTTPPRRVSAP